MRSDDRLSGLDGDVNRIFLSALVSAAPGSHCSAPNLLHCLLQVSVVSSCLWHPVWKYSSLLFFFSFSFSPLKKISRDLSTGGLRKRASEFNLITITQNIQNSLVTVVTWPSLRGHNHSRIWAGFPDSKCLTVLCLIMQSCCCWKYTIDE